MSEHRLGDYLDHIQKAAQDACSFVEGLPQQLPLVPRETED